MTPRVLLLLERLVRGVERIASRSNGSTESQGFGDDGADRQLREAMERYQRDLPMTVDQVAVVLNISERSVRRLLTPIGRTGAGGTGWYSRQQVENIWREKRSQKVGDSGSPPLVDKPSHSSTVGQGVGKSKRRSKDTGASEPLSAQEVEKRLRKRRSSTSPTFKRSRLRLIRPPSPE